MFAGQISMTQNSSLKAQLRKEQTFVFTLQWWSAVTISTLLYSFVDVTFDIDIPDLDLDAW